MAPKAEKAANYLEQLDDARCEGRWDVVPELVRKVKKHAPDRSCLALTVETEYAIAKATKSESGSPRPSTAAAKELDISKQLPKLLTAAESENVYAEDKFQANVCIGWLHWVVGEHNLAAIRLPKNLDQEYSRLQPLDRVSEWTHICALKAAYLKANLLARGGKRAEALAVFESGLPSLGIVWTGDGASGKELFYWAELFLTEFCMVASQAILGREKALDDANSLAAFRSWARYWEALKVSGSGSVPGGYGFRGSLPRRRVWNEYYIALSTILEEDLSFPTAYLEKIPSEMSARMQLRIELKKVESVYEGLLLSETTFPRAEEEREEVEAFAKLVAKNWTVLSGRGWREYDLGQGGRESLSRGVLDILYRAATKTFHSTPILRFLFIVHLSVAEFDLAFKAFDSYLEIVKKGRARVEKTGKFEPSLDDDNTILETVSQCVVALSRFGDRSAAEKARDLGAELEDWLARLRLGQSMSDDGNPTSLAEIEENLASPSPPRVAPNVVALCWQAMGLAHANWSRITFDASSRLEIQTKAVRCLRRSLSAEYGRPKDVRSLFALGLLLAERRELTPAIEILKTALLTAKSDEDENEVLHGLYWQERSLIPLWHLLALLLSARQEYVMAARACEGAFEQFKDPAVLFGDTDLAFRSDHLNEANEKKADSRRGLVDELEDFEKEGILEVKMTQLALVEILEGPDVAVNASSELLSLYARLFGPVQPKPLNPPQTTNAPKSSAGTLRSIRGTIFGSRSGRATREVSVVSEKSNMTSESRPQTTQTTQTAASIAPTIQVTQENGTMETQSQHSRRPPRSSHRRRSESSRRVSLRKRDSSGSRRRTMSSGPHPHLPTMVDGDSYFTPEGEGHLDFFSSPPSARRQPSIASSFSRGPTLGHLDSYISKAKSMDFSDASLGASYTIATPLPIIQFSKDQEKRLRSVFLAKVWLMIAGFYRRAGRLDDCKGAVAEAQKLVQGLESEFARDTTGAITLRGVNWGEKKSIDELWGDVWTESGHLSIAKGAPFTARAEFEAALTHFPDHSGAIVGLSNILLDIYTEALRPAPLVPALHIHDAFTDTTVAPAVPKKPVQADATLPSRPLGLGSTQHFAASQTTDTAAASTSSPKPRRRPAPPESLLSEPMTTAAAARGGGNEEELTPPYKALSLPLLDRLAARDRAHGLLSGLAKLGTGWNDAEVWFALARAHEESGQADRAKEVLWWCVELEEGSGVRDWRCLAGGGYVV